MKLSEIENLPADELKRRRDELRQVAAKAAPADLAARYVQARTDATARDAKLAEQGETITNLNAALSAAQQEAADARAPTSASNCRPLSPRPRRTAPPWASSGPRPTPPCRWPGIAAWRSPP